MTWNRKRSRAGFTLLEVMIVVAILVALATVGVVGVTGALRANNRKVAQAKVENTQRAVKMYEIAMGSLPETDEGLEALITPPDDEDEQQRWVDGGGPFIEGGVVPTDPWNNELKYVLQDSDGETSGQSFVVYSFGPNGVDDEGSEDDIPNWADQE